MKEKMKKTMKKICGIPLALGVLLLTLVGIPALMNVSAAGETRLVVQNNNNTISISGTDLVYKIGETTVGTVKVKVAGTASYLTPVMNNGKAEYTFDGATSVDVEVNAENGYDKQPTYFFNASSDSFPGDNILHLDLISANVNILDFAFEAASNPGSGSGPEGPMVVYPIVAYFEGNPTGVTMNESSAILIPDNWTTGKVTFKAKTCTVGDAIAPDDGFTVCDADSQEEIAVRVEGIANSSQINNTVIVGGDRSFVTVGSGFSEYGKVAIHITNFEENGPVNTIINIITEDLINIRADAPIPMSHSFGSSAVDQAIITADEPKDVSIFFGNTETTLFASGINVDKITAVSGAETVLNRDGSATLTLPDLSVETTTSVRVTILLRDGTSITRAVNIKRTAIMLDYDDRENELRAGYVMNKGYLYNNQAHNDSIFNAYLQVIYYKGNTVASYKQVKIDDEEIVNGLYEDESWSIETFGENPILLYEGEPTGITKVSVFLTNGPLDSKSDTLPSIEFGIGAGLEISWEDE